MQLAEGKPWEEDVAGTLNGASYAAIGYFGASIPGLRTVGKRTMCPIQRVAVDALTTTLASIITDVQEGLTGSSSFQDGTNTRVRGVLRTVLDAVPPPFGQDEATWAAVDQDDHRSHSLDRRCRRATGRRRPSVTADIETLATIAPIRTRRPDL